MSKVGKFNDIFYQVDGGLVLLRTKDTETVFKTHSPDFQRFMLDILLGIEEDLKSTIANEDGDVKQEQVDKAISKLNKLQSVKNSMAEFIRNDCLATCKERAELLKAGYTGKGIEKLYILRNGFEVVDRVDWDDKGSIHGTEGR